jgi:hypothetical protein
MLLLLLVLACCQLVIGWQLEWRGSNATNHSIAGNRSSTCIPVRIRPVRGADCCTGDPPAWKVLTQGCCISFFLAPRCSRLWAKFCDSNSTSALPELPPSIRSVRVDGCGFDDKTI